MMSQKSTKELICQGFVLSSVQYLLQITKRSDQEPAPRFDILVQLQPPEGLGAWQGGGPGTPLPYSEFPGCAP